MLLLLVSAPVRGDLIGQWRTTRTIGLPPLQAPAAVYLPLDENALAGVESFSEYRIVRAGHFETPYRMVEERGQTETYPLEAKTIAQSQPGEEPETITLDLGDRPASQLRLIPQLAGNDFRCRVEVSGSHDGQQWQIVTDRAYLYRRQGNAELSELMLPFRQDRLLRLHLIREQGSLPRIQRVDVSSVVTLARRLISVPASMSRKEDVNARRTSLELDAGQMTRDLVEARFDISEAAFDRPVTIETERNGHWEYLASGALRRLAGGGAVTLPLDISQALRVRISIVNGDDAPLTISAVTLWRMRRGLIFVADPGQLYELRYGRAGVSAPTYELERMPLTVAPTELPQASLGEPRMLPPPPKPPTPWSERHSWLFWSVLTGVVALLLLLIVRSMRGIKIESGHSEV